jgi:hypothetical protein
MLHAVTVGDTVHFAVYRPHRAEFGTLCKRKYNTIAVRTPKKIHGKGTCFNCVFDAMMRHQWEPIRRWRGAGGDPWKVA